MGNINRAVGLFSESPDSGVLDMSDVFQELNLRNPDVSPKYDGFLLNDPVNEVPDLIFDSINEKGIQKATKRTRGAAGPSKLFDDKY